MKLPLPQKEKSTVLESSTLLRGKKVVRIKHHQTIRVSLDYSSAELSYGVELECDDNPVEIQNTIQKAETLVEEPLTAKFQDQQRFLKNLSQSKGGK